MKVLHIGPPSSQHTQMAALAYYKLGYEMVFLNTRRDRHFDKVPGVKFDHVVINPWQNRTRPVISRKMPKTLFSSLTLAFRYIGFHDRDLVSALTELKNKHKIDLVIGSWGMPVLEATLIAQKIFTNAKFVHNILTIPDLPIMVNGFRGLIWKLFLYFFNLIQDSAYSRMLNKIDLIVAASPQMKDFIVDKFKLRCKNKVIIRIERFNIAYFPDKREKKYSENDGKIHVVHLGATNFNTGLEIDEVSEQLISLGKAKIVVHFHAKSLPIVFREFDENSFVLFEKFKNDLEENRNQFAEFLTQFDAIVMLYNVKKKYERFTNSLPTRFLFGLTIGIPIVLPKGLFIACENYIIEHGIGFAYENEIELFEIMSNKFIMDKYSKNALRHSKQLSFESNIDDFKFQIHQLLNN